MRIFVTVGNAHTPFDRLLHWTRAALAQYDGAVYGLCQTGTSTISVPPLGCHSKISRPRFDHELQEADLVITHAGIGTLADAMDAGHTPLVAPRSASLGEHIDDHQSEIAEHLAAHGRARLIRSPRDIREAFFAWEAGALRRRPSASGLTPEQLQPLEALLKAAPYDQAVGPIKRKLLDLLTRFSQPPDHFRLDRHASSNT